MAERNRVKKDKTMAVTSILKFATRISCIYSALKMRNYNKYLGFAPILTPIPSNDSAIIGLHFWPSDVTINCWLNDIRPNDVVLKMKLPF